MLYFKRASKRVYKATAQRANVFLMAPEDGTARCQNEMQSIFFLSVILTMARRRFSEKSADRQHFFCFMFSNNFITARGKIIDFFAVVMRPRDFL
jgi:hypothetical protein